MLIEIDVNTRSIIGKPINCLKPKKGFWLPVVDNSTYPDEPDLFKASPAYTYSINVDQWLDEAEIKGEWSFSENDYVEQVAVQGVKSLESCKNELYKLQKKAKKEKEIQPLLFKDKLIDISTEDNKNRIHGLKDKGKKFKVGTNDYMDLTSQDVKDLQELLGDTLDTAISKEAEDNEEVNLIGNYGALKAYYLASDFYTTPEIFIDP